MPKWSSVGRQLKKTGALPTAPYYNLLRMLARSCKEVRVHVDPSHPRSGMFRELRSRFLNPELQQDFPEFRFHLQTNTEGKDATMELHFKNDVVKKFEFEGVNTGEAWGTLDAYVSFLEQSVYRKSLLEREKHLWWRFETPEEIKNAQAMHDSMEKDMELCWERGEQGIGDGIFR